MKKHSRRFFKNENGSFLILFGLSFSCVLYIALMGLDYANTEKEGQKLQQVLDATTVSLATMDDVTEDNVQARGVALMQQKYDDFTNVKKVTFALTQSGTVVKGDAAIGISNTYAKAFSKEGRVVNRSSESLLPLNNVDIQIFIDSSLTMGLPSVPVAKVEDIMDGGCIFACHDGGTTARKLGYETKLDVVNRAVKGMVKAIDDANSIKKTPSHIMYSLYRYQEGPYWSSKNNYEIDNNPWPDPGLKTVADLANGRDTVPVAPLVSATTDVKLLEKELNKTWDLVGGSNLNTPLKVMYDNIRFQNAVKKWQETNPGPYDIKNNLAQRNKLFSEIPGDIGIPQNKFFKAMKAGTETRENEIIQNLTHTTKRTFVIFISDGDHRRSPEQFNFQNCNNIKNIKNTSLYTVMVQNDPNTYAVQWRKFGDINFVGYEKKDKFGIYGLDGDGYIYGLDHGEELMRSCATSQNHFFKAEYEQELYARFRELAKRLATDIPRLVNSK